MAADRTAKLLGCYPGGKPSDPETYVAAVAAILADYPPEIVARVTDPVHGIARSQKFLPTVAEISAACEEAMIEARKLWKEGFDRRRAIAEVRAEPTEEQKARVREIVEQTKNSLKADLPDAK